MDVSIVAAGWSGSGHIVVCPKQETTLWQSIECHLVRTPDLDGGIGSLAALQSAYPAEIRFGGDANDHPCPRQFFFYRPLQGFGVLQEGLLDPI